MQTLYKEQDNRSAEIVKVGPFSLVRVVNEKMEVLEQVYFYNYEDAREYWGQIK